MSKLETALQNLPTIVKYALVIGVVIFISTLFPNQNQFPYTVTEGAIWSHDDLVAPFDFDVLKSEIELEEERKQLQEEFLPIYVVDNSVLENRKQALEKAFQLKLELEESSGAFTDVFTQPDRYLKRGFAIAQKIYETKGILQLAPEHQNLPSDFKIKILEKGQQERVNFPSVYMNSKRAAEETVGGLFQSGLPEADFMMSLMEESFFLPNITYDDSVTIHLQNEILANISQVKRSVAKGDFIIENGEEITAKKYQVLKSLEENYTRQSGGGEYSWSVWLGYFLLTSLLIGVYLFYLQFNAEEIFEKYSWLIFNLLWIVVFSYLVYIVEQSDTLNAYMIPFCIVPIVLKSFYNERVALFTHIVIILMASFLSSEDYEFTFIQMLAGIVAVLTPIETRDWTKFFYFLLTIFGAYVLGFLGLSLIKNTGWESMNWSTYGWIFWSVFLTLLAYPLIPLSERIFGFTSSITLAELSDVNKPLLKSLSEKAPGTFQHSIQVGNLASAAASKINANALLVKTAALYHDIGKMENPHFFIENQNGKNPHDELNHPEKSAEIIIQHVIEGVKLAKKNRLPAVLIDFILTHHGTTRVEYFYKKYKELNPTQKVDEQLFKYPGPKPTTKEQTILLLADSIEAAAKTLKKPTEDSIKNLVHKIVANKIEQGQLTNSELTFEELEICIQEFRSVLKGIYHARIEY